MHIIKKPVKVLANTSSPTLFIRADVATRLSLVHSPLQTGM